MTRPRAPARTGVENIASKPCVTPMGKPQKAIPMKTPARHWRRSKISPMPRSMLFPQQCSTQSYFAAERERHLAFIAVDCLPKCDRNCDELDSHAVRSKPWETFASVSCSSCLLLSRRRTRVPAFSFPSASLRRHCPFTSNPFAPVLISFGRRATGHTMRMSKITTGFLVSGCAAPVVGYLWTPGYWGWSDNLYVWHAGYWGPHVGYYGGIDYGFGYAGRGYYGGHWDHATFVYNTAVTRVNTTIIHNTYNQTVVVNHEHATRVSVNGGPGGVVAKPTIEDRAAAAEHHMPWTPTQTEHHIAASKQRELRASINHGTPSLAAVSHTPALIDRQSNAPQPHTLEKHNQHSDRFYPGDFFVPSKHPNHHDPRGRMISPHDRAQRGSQEFHVQEQRRDRKEPTHLDHDPRGRMISPHDRVQRGSQEFHVQEQRRDRKELKQGEYR